MEYRFGETSSEVSIQVYLCHYFGRGNLDASFWQTIVSYRYHSKIIDPYMKVIAAKCAIKQQWGVTLAA